MRNNSDLRQRVGRARLLLSDFEYALGRLRAALAKPEDEYIRDATIQRFEFTFELAWKSIQGVARLEGRDCSTPRAAFSLAWEAHWIEDEDLWLDMLEARNKTTHTYREKTAEEVFSALPGFVPALEYLLRSLTMRIPDL